MIHVVNHSAQSRSLRLTAEDREDLIAQVFLAIVKDDMAVLRNFRGGSSLATYLTVIARRVVVHDLVKQKQPARLGAGAAHAAVALADGDAGHIERAGAAVADRREVGELEQRVSDREEVERLLEELDGTEAEIVRLYHLEGKTYQEISSAVGMPENSVGPALSRRAARCAGRLANRASSERTARLARRPE